MRMPSWFDIPSLNFTEKQDKENAEKLQQKKYDYQNYLNLSHIKNSKSHKMIKDEYYNHTKLEQEFEDFLQHQQLYTSKREIEEHIRDKNTYLKRKFKFIFY